MIWKYPDFAFSTNTQIVLFIVTCITTTVYHYWGVNIILQIYQKNESYSRKILFSFLSAMFLYILAKNSACIINYFADKPGAPDILGRSFICLTEFMMPTSYIVLYFFGVKILRLSRYKSSKIMLLSYIYYMCSKVVRKLPGLTLFPKGLSDPRGSNYLRDLLAVLCGMLICYALYKLTSKVIDRFGLYVNFIENNTIVSIRHELLKNFMLCCTIYFFNVIIYSFFPVDFLDAMLMSFVCISYLFGIVCREHIKICQRQIGNKDEHIAILNQTIDEFKGVRHDFNNILQTYTGYLAIEDVENLRIYHKKVTKLMAFAGNNLDMSRRLNENPSFFSLILNKIEKAAEVEVVMQITFQCSMQFVYIDILDFNRIMSILLDNAIEAAAQTTTKQVSVNGQMKPDGSKFFIIANDTTQDVKIEDILKPGYTTKEGHMGQGIPQVRSILDKYCNSTIDFSCYKGSFTVYFEVKV